MTTTREINAALRTGAYVRLLSTRYGTPTQRIVRARTVRGWLQVKSLATGHWLDVLADDKIERY